MYGMSELKPLSFIFSLIRPGVSFYYLKRSSKLLRDVRHEDIPEINNPKIRFPVLEGDKLMKEVLNGGYNVHPVPPPNSEIKERIRKRYERERIKIEKLLTLGYTTSGDP